MVLNPQAIEDEKARLELEKLRLEVAQLQIGQIDQVKKYDTVVSSGQSALRALLTLNGGATIAFLTFIGHFWDKGALSSDSSHLFVAALLGLEILSRSLGPVVVSSNADKNSR
jgi:hypothetical protein